MRRALRAGRLRLVAEGLALFGGVPLLVGLGRPHIAVLAVPGVLAALAAAWLVLRRGYDWQHLWRGRGEGARLRQLLRRFTLTAPVLTVLLLIVAPRHFLALPDHHAEIWALLLVAYPLASVISQELLYRPFLFERYGRLFESRVGSIVASALAFAWMHIAFGNAWAVLFTLVGGLFFAHTYATSGSLRLVWLEHSLYGLALFTLGWGPYFTYQPG